MTDTKSRSRQPARVPVGGEFAKEAGASTGVTLPGWDVTGPSRTLETSAAEPGVASWLSQLQRMGTSGKVSWGGVESDGERVRQSLGVALEGGYFIRFDDERPDPGVLGAEPTRARFTIRLSSAEGHSAQLVLERKVSREPEISRRRLIQVARDLRLREAADRLGVPESVHLHTEETVGPLGSRGVVAHLADESGAIKVGRTIFQEPSIGSGDDAPGVDPREQMRRMLDQPDFIDAQLLEVAGQLRDAAGDGAVPRSLLELR